MPALDFLASVGLVLLALLFVADATLEPGSPVIFTSQRSGLPAPQYNNAIKTLNTAPAPAPDMTSQAVPSRNGARNADDRTAAPAKGIGGDGHALGRHYSLEVEMAAVQNVTFKLVGLCPLLAQSRHELVHRACPLSGVKRT
jgi:hypothetical protein